MLFIVALVPTNRFDDRNDFRGREVLPQLVLGPFAGGDARHVDDASRNVLSAEKLKRTNPTFSKHKHRIRRNADRLQKSFGLDRSSQRIDIAEVLPVPIADLDFRYFHRLE